MYDKILVTLDGSSLAEMALPHAERLAKAYGSEIVLLEVVHPPAPYVDASGVTQTAEIDDAYVERASKAATTYLSETANSLKEKGVKAVSRQVKVGEPAELIIDYANEIGAGIIVMATHGRSGVKRWMYGSVAEKVLRHASTPILLARAGVASEA